MFPFELERTREIMTRSASFPWYLSIVETFMEDFEEWRADSVTIEFKYFNCGR